MAYRPRLPLHLAALVLSLAGLSAVPAHASCGIVAANGTVTVVVGTKAGGCNASPNFKESLVADINKEMAARSPVDSRPSMRGVSARFRSSETGQLNSVDAPVPRRFGPRT